MLYQGKITIQVGSAKYSRIYSGRVDRELMIKDWKETFTTDFIITIQPYIKCKTEDCEPCIMEAVSLQSLPSSHAYSYPDYYTH